MPRGPVSDDSWIRMNNVKEPRPRRPRSDPYLCEFDFSHLQDFRGLFDEREVEEVMGRMEEMVVDLNWKLRKIEKKLDKEKRKRIKRGKMTEIEKEEEKDFQNQHLLDMVLGYARNKASLLRLIEELDSGMKSPDEVVEDIARIFKWGDMDRAYE